MNEGVLNPKAWYCWSENSPQFAFTQKWTDFILLSWWGHHRKRTNSWRRLFIAQQGKVLCSKTIILLLLDHLANKIDKTPFQCHCLLFIFYFLLFFKLNLLGWHWLMRLYRSQVYNPTIHHLYIASCAYPLLLKRSQIFFSCWSFKRSFPIFIIIV